MIKQSGMAEQERMKTEEKDTLTPDLSQRVLNLIVNDDSNYHLLVHLT